MTKRFEYVDAINSQHLMAMTRIMMEKLKLQTNLICGGPAPEDDDSEYDDDEDNIEIKSANNLTARSDDDDFYDEYDTFSVVVEC